MINSLNIHAGHSLFCRGAMDLLDEVKENRLVKNKLMELFTNVPSLVVCDCTDDNGRTVSENLTNIITKCNKNKMDLDISIHLNAGRNDHHGDGKTGGVEVWGWDYQTKDIGEKICNAISNTLHINNRGYKISKEYYFLKNTINKAIIIECCFVDDKDDFKQWNAELCAQAIFSALNLEHRTLIPKMVEIIPDGNHYVVDKNGNNNTLFYEKYEVMDIVDDYVKIGIKGTPTCWVHKNKIKGGI